MIRFITIGQSPRTDIVPELLSIVGKHVPYVEEGLLDHVEDPFAYEPISEDDLLVSRLRDGRSVRISHKWASAKIRQCDTSWLSVLLCTADFESSEVVLPGKVVQFFFESLPRFEKLLVIVPDPNQIPVISMRWKRFASRVACLSHSPYVDESFHFDLLDDYDLIYLDCMGYTLKHEEALRARTTAVVLSARRILGNFLRCLV